MREFKILYQWQGRHYETYMRHVSGYAALSAAEVMVMTGAKVYGIEVMG